MATIFHNDYIHVDGVTLYGGYDTVFTIYQDNPACEYVQVAYRLGLGQSTYWFDNNGEIALPMGDYARAMVESGLTGSQELLTLEHPLFDEVPVVRGTVLAGIQAAQESQCFPPRRPIPLAGTGVPWVAVMSPLGQEGQTYEVKWNGGSSDTETTDDHGEITGTFDDVEIWTTDGVPSLLWKCTPRTDYCGETAYVEWKSDSGARKGWVFEALSVTRSVTDSIRTEGVGVLRGMFFPTRKNWKYSIKVKVSGLAVDETWYFDDLVTGEITGMTVPYMLIEYAGMLAGSPVQGTVTGKKLTRSLSEPLTDITFDIDCFEIKNF